MHTNNKCMHREPVPREEVAAKIIIKVVEVKVKVKAKVEAKNNRTKVVKTTNNLNNSSNRIKMINKRLSVLDVAKKATRLPSVLIEQDRLPRQIKHHLLKLRAAMGQILMAIRHRPEGASNLLKSI